MALAAARHPTPEFRSRITQPHRYPRDLSIPQFLLDQSSHPLRPSRLPGHPWLIDDDTGRSYRLEEVRDRVERLARALRKRWCIETGDVVCLFSQNHIDYPIVVWALHRLGAVVSCANPSYTSGELEYQLRETSSTLLLTSSTSLCTALAAVKATGLFSKENVVILDTPQLLAPGQNCFALACPPESHIDDDCTFTTVEQLVAEGWDLDLNYTEPRGPRVGETVALLSFSSGTTGLPKAIAIPHKNVIAVVIQIVAHARANEKGLIPHERFARPGDTALGALPLYHIYGFAVNLHAALFCGMSYVVVPKFNFQKSLATIVRHRITHLYMVPPMVVMFVNDPIVKHHDLSSLRFAIVAAAPLSEEVTDMFNAIFPHVRMGQAFGMTETASILTQFDFHAKSVNGSSGTLLPDTVAKIVREDGQMAEHDEPGELWVKGPQSEGIYYVNNEKATQDTFFPDGWVRTGDKALMSEQGQLFVVDRLKEMLKVNGYQVAPAELEGHLIIHPYVQDTGVVGVPDKQRGEVPLAFVVLSAEAHRVAGPGLGDAIIKEELKKWVREHKVRYKWLEGVEFVQAIPKNPSGKILRRLLRVQAQQLIAAR
ncbi:acetyl-CoA synthetase-like protein [Dacryopinax primogenitus]|uniref:Acetyl-CoA synthetase-like protein n=1 Tax=Dacryopinax primogenitus (strain DJM 731) TaxID=1858805 RepID=M5FPY9_DACPD|nr:acetyl-CoA synthetase-like protein [Dacryopinax primogenitus]EJT97423.1 acetyl-CoA synthetase-like protein [Dacryopinax primogenitus]